MFSIFDFVKKLLPRSDRETIEEELRITAKELDVVVMPSYESASDFFKLHKPQSKSFMKLQNTFYQNVTISSHLKSTNFIGDITNRLKFLKDIVAYLQSEVSAKLSKDIMPSGTTAYTAFILRSVTNISYMSRYMLSLLNYVYRVEENDSKSGSNYALSISKEEMAYVEQNFYRFSRLFAQYAIELKTYEKMLKQVPDVYLSDASKAVLSSTKLDPFEKNAVAGFTGSPILCVSMVVAEWQHDRYESAKSKKRQLELRQLHLRTRLERGSVEPHIENEISRLQDRIEKLDRRIRRVEENMNEG